MAEEMEKIVEPEWIEGNHYRRKIKTKALVQISQMNSILYRFNLKSIKDIKMNLSVPGIGSPCAVCDISCITGDT